MRQRTSRRQKQIERDERAAAIVEAQTSPPDRVWQEAEMERARDQLAQLAREFGSKNAGGGW